MTALPRPCRLLLTRDRGRDTIRDHLSDAGATVTCVGLTELVPCQVSAHDVSYLDSSDWFVLTSANTLRFLDVTRLPATTRLAAVGPASAAALERAVGRKVEVVGHSDGAALGRLLPSCGLSAGEHVVLPQSALASAQLATLLSAAGALVHRITPYTSQPRERAHLDADLLHDWEAGYFDAVIVTSASQAAALAVLGPYPRATRLIALGEPSAQGARDADLEVSAVASHPTPQAVCEALVSCLAPPAAPDDAQSPPSS